MVFSILGCVVCFGLGILFESMLYKRRTLKEQDQKFGSSKYLLEFFVQILSIVLAALITLAATGWHSDFLGKKQCMKTLDQTVSLAAKQIKSSVKIYGSYVDEEASRDYMIRWDTLPLNFYETMINDPDVMSRISINGYYEVVRYLTAVSVQQDKINDMLYDPDISDKDIQKSLNRRNLDFYKFLINLKVATLELDGKITEDDASNIRTSLLKSTTNGWTAINTIVKDNNLDLPVFNNRSSDPQ